MTYKARRTTQWLISAMMTASLLVIYTGASLASALTPIPPPDPKPGSYGLEATKTQAAPSRGATITAPGSGASFSSSPITVSGICPDGLLVQLLNNEVMVGSVMCESGSFRVEVSLFAGENELKAMVYDDIDQAGPESNTVTVTYSDTNFSSFGDIITLTSSFGRRSAAAGSQLVWPLQLAGGTGPYAFSIDWGDGTDTQLLSQAMPGVVSIDHVYRQAGIYQVNVRVVDSNDANAFLQLIAVANGIVDPSLAEEVAAETVTRTEILWLPAAIAFGLLFPAFWLGRRSQLISLRNQMLKERDSYQK